MQTLEASPNRSHSDAIEPRAIGRLAVLRNQDFILGMILVLSMTAILYTVVAASWPKFSRAEVFFAECAREMLKSSNYVTPLYHGKPFFDKPIFVYWLILSGFKTFGVSHLIARIPSIIGGLLAVAATGIGTALVAGALPGVLAAMALGSSFMYFSFASLCMSDMLLTLFDTMTLALLYAGTLSDKRRTFLWWLASASMGMAFLTKGPVGLVLPTISFLLYLGITRQLSLLRPVHFLIGAVTAAVVASPWFLAAYHANGAGAMQYFFLHENLERFAGSTYDSHRPVWFMLLSLLTGFAPWSVFMPLVLAGSIRKWKEGLVWPESQRELYLWLWITVVILFFSFSRGKIDYYALPAYPAAAALTAIYLGRWIVRRERPAATGGWGLAACFMVGGIISGLFLQRMVPGAGPTQWILMPATLTLTGLLMAMCMHHGQYFKAYSLVFTGVCLAAVGFSLQILPAIVNLQPVLSYVSEVRKSPAETRIGIYRTVDSWIDEVTFQTGREPIKIADNKEMIALLNGEKPALLVVPKDKFEELPAAVLVRVRILESRPFIAHSINPGFAIQSNGKLASSVPLLLVSNRE